MFSFIPLVPMCMHKIKKLKPVDGALAHTMNINKKLLQRVVPFLFKVYTERVLFAQIIKFT